jgi:hypothetical protein
MREREGDRESDRERDRKRDEERETERLSLSTMSYLVSLSPSHSSLSFLSLSSTPSYTPLHTTEEDQETANTDRETERDRQIDRQRDRERDRERDGERVSNIEKKEFLSIQLTYLGILIIFSLLSLCLFSILLGTYIDTMAFHFKGLVGLMLQDQAETSYSFMDIGATIPLHSGSPHARLVKWLQISFFLFGLGMPLAYLLCTYVLWFYPMTLKAMKRLQIVTEVMNAWAALDVFCVSIAAALLEIEQFALFVVGDSCDRLNLLLEKYLDPWLDGDDQCFDVVAGLNKVRACFMFLSLVWVVSNFISLSLCIYLCPFVALFVTISLFLSHSLSFCLSVCLSV